MKTAVEITPLAEVHFKGLHDTFDAVARERRFFPILEAPSIDVSFAFYRHILNQDFPHFIAIDNGKVIGWCDIIPKPYAACSHVGTLGIGIIAAMRHQGIGRLLMEKTIQKAWEKGLTRIELTVRSDNHNAKTLYEHLGFVQDGLQKNAFYVGGQYYDLYTMALLKPLHRVL